MQTNPLYNPEAEKSTLGACLIGGKIAVLEAQEIIKPADFQEEKNRVICEAIFALNDANKPVDAITVSDELGKYLEKVGGIPYLISLANSMPTAANIKYYAEIVKSNSITRQMLSEVQDVAARLRDGENPYEVISQSMINASRIISEGSKNSIIHVKESVGKVYNDLGTRRDNDGIVGLPCGFKDLDRKLGGMRDANLIILASRPSMGKTTFALNLAKHAAFELKIPTIMWSLEMISEQLIEKMMAEDADLNSGMMQNTSRLTDSDWSRLAAASRNLAESQLYIDDTPCKISQLAIKLKKFKALNPNLGLVIIDYLQLIASDKRGNRQEEVSEISRALKNLSIELRIPILALSQLSRALEQRDSKIPMLSDLRESGSLEQDADSVLFLYRDDYYNKEKYPPGNDPSLTNCIIAKNRHGALGMVDFMFIKAKSRFAQIDPNREVQVPKTVSKKPEY